MKKQLVKLSQIATEFERHGNLEAGRILTQTMQKISESKKIILDRDANVSHYSWFRPLPQDRGREIPRSGVTLYPGDEISIRREDDREMWVEFDRGDGYIQNGYIKK